MTNDKAVHIGDVKIPLQDFAVARSGILGITRSGKTYCAKGVAEQLLDAGVPIIVFDAIGVWRFLKTPGDGPKAKGYPVVVAGGEHPDLPLTVESAPEIVRAAMRENVPLVIDLYDSKLSKAQWRKIVQSCFRTLLYENKSVRHIFLEEAAEYAPQKIMDGETYAEVEKLARMGGNKGLGITFINQRAQELNKAVLELSDNLILLRQRGSHAIDALQKWLDRVSPDTAKEIAVSLPHMTQGDCWVWTESSEKPVRTHTNQIRSFHPDRRTLNEAEVARKSVDAGKFVAKMTGELGKLVEQAKANDPAALKRRIAELEKQLTARPKEQVEKIVEKVVEVPVLKNGQLDRTEKILDRVQGVADKFVSEMTELRRLIAPAAAPRPAPRPAPVARPVVQRPAPAARVAPTTEAGDATIDKCARKILAVLANYPAGAEIGKIALLTGYRVSGGFRNSLSSLRTAGFIEGENTGTMRITERGLANATPENIPTGQDFVNYWLNHGSLDRCAKAVLSVLVNHPDGMQIEELAHAAGYEVSGGFRNALSDLRTAGVIVGKNTGRMRASDELLEAATA